MIIEDPVLAERVAAVIEDDVQPENSWRVSLDDEGNLLWTSSSGTVDRQPARGTGQRLADWFYTLLPLESQL